MTLGHVLQTANISTTKNMITIRANKDTTTPLSIQCFHTGQVNHRRSVLEPECVCEASSTGHYLATLMSIQEALEDAYAVTNDCQTIKQFDSLILGHKVKD